MKKKTFNFLLLAMSTFNFEKNTEKKILPKYRYITAESDDDTKEYYSQLEPVSREIISNGIIPDQIIVLCTKETLKEEKFYLSDDLEHEVCYSPYNFYKERISEYLPDGKKDIFSCVDIDTSNINLGIINTANLIIRKKAEIEKNLAENDETEFKLWIDTQGSFRDLVFIMNAVMNLLKIQKITIAGIYSVQFTKQRNPESIIKEQTDNYRIFDFVSGMNEFIMYGRADQLLNYYQSNSPDLMNILNAMKNVADSIQMCDPRGFLEYKKQLKEAISEYEEQHLDNSEELFRIFINEVKNDYGVLLKDECTNIDIIDWFYRKQFYQQALTFIESKIPSELCEKNIIAFEYDKDKIFEIKKKDKKRFEEDNNYILLQFLTQISKFTINKLFLQYNINNAENDYQNKMRENILKICDRYGFLSNKHQSTYEVDKYGEKLVMNINDAVFHKINQLRIFLFLFSVLKKERNNFNHMSDSTTNRATKQELDMTIALFVKAGKRLYKTVLETE